jgi:methyl-accepting chemotaxis protein
LDTVIQQNASATEQMSATSEELAGQADQLLDVASFFKVKNGHGQAGHMQPAARNRPANIQHIHEARSARPVPAVSSSAAPAEVKQLGVNIDMSDPEDVEFERF